MKWKAVIFDLDGTLLNTLGDLSDALNTALAARGLDAVSEDTVRQRVGNGARKLITRSLPEGADDAAIDAALADFRAAYDSAMTHRTQPYPGICEMLRQIQSAGIRIAVLSNKYDKATQALMAAYFPGLIELAFGERPPIPRKPDPTAVREILSAFGMSEEETLYVGDSSTDIETAHNAGLKVAAVSWGFRDRSSLFAAGADFLVDDPSQLIGLLCPCADIEGLRAAFTARGFAVSHFSTGAQAAAYLAEQCAGRSVSFGGSMTLDEIGAYEALTAAGADVKWHWKGDAPCTDAEVFLTSANALSQTGEIVNIDGSCNRVAASLWGCKTCFVVCGVNKIAPDLNTALDRARNVASPFNARRLQRKTPCAVDGRCHDCRAPERICRAFVVLSAPPFPIERYELVLVDEILGY